MSTAVPALIARVYACLLHAYPSAFREEYGGEMRSAFRAHWRDTPSAAGRAALCASVAFDTVMTAPRVHAEAALADVRYGLRVLADVRSRSFALASIVTIAMTIGAVTTVFSVARAVLYAPLPYRAPAEVVSISPGNAQLGVARFSESTPNFISLRQRARSLSGLVAMKDASANITDAANPERVTGIAVTTDFFDVLGLPPLAGRAFVDGDAPSGSVMISRGLWARRFGSSPAAIGSTMAVNLAPRVIVGVVPQDAGFRNDVDLWTVLDLGEPESRRGDRRLSMLGRLKPGVSIAQAGDELNAIGAALEADYPAANRNWRYTIAPVRDWIVGPDLSTRLRLLLAAVMLLLLVGAANVANLQLARAAGREREVAVRLALGASRARIARQLLTEALLLGAFGGAAGMALAWIGARAAASSLGDTIPRAGAIAIDAQVLAVATIATVLTALLAGLLPGTLAARANVSEALGRGGRSPGTGRAPMRRALVMIQLALATSLVIGAALLAQSLFRLQRVPLGFADPSRLLTAEITRADPAAGSEERDLAFYDALIERVSALPGVVAAGVSNSAPFGNGDTAMPVQPFPNNSGAAVAPLTVSWRIVSPDYFRAMQIPVERGQLFNRATDPLRVMIISSSLARILWPAEGDVVGRTVKLGNGQVFTVIGVVGDVRLVGLASGPTPAMYIPTHFFLWPTMTLVVRTAVDPAGLSAQVRQAVAAIDPRQPVGAFATMEGAIATSVAAPRLNAGVLASFAVLALMLAAIGVAGLVSYAVSQRRAELAVRMALGASPRRAVWHVLSDTLTMTIAGIAAGVAGALLLGRGLGAVLFGITPSDPSTYTATAATLLGIAAIAAWLPARRTARINPASALR
jgi:putative ABC transport system permease protein